MLCETVLYVIVAGIALFVGLIHVSDGDAGRVRLGARLVLSCWAWPVWLVAGFVVAVRELWWLATVPVSELEER